ncbi:MAG TPA: nitroreductase family protein, partial [Planctomycetota bacterium]|nr:nitroreductase family protein [Planctomycetota bacterium]
MRNIRLQAFLGALCGALWAFAPAVAGEDPTAAKPAKIELPKPREKADVDVLAALKGRHSSRDFDAKKPIPDDVLATVLWAADGVNRPDGKHTAPTALGVRHMRIYVCRADGAWRYDQDAHVLLAVSKEDLRARIARQKPFAEAQAILVFTSDLAAFDAKAARADKAVLVFEDANREGFELIKSKIYLMKWSSCEARTVPSVFPSWRLRTSCLSATIPIFSYSGIFCFSRRQALSRNRSGRCS